MCCPVLVKCKGKGKERTREKNTQKLEKMRRIMPRRKNEYAAKRNPFKRNKHHPPRNNGRNSRKCSGEALEL